MIGVCLLGLVVALSAGVVLGAEVVSFAATGKYHISAAGDARASSRFSDALRRFACPTGTAVSQGFRTASRMASDAPHRRATRS